MKLIIAIVQDEDAGRLVNHLMDDGFSVTKLATTGGFLKAGNTTLLIGVADDRLDGCLGIIESVCKSRTQIAPSPVPMGGAPGPFAGAATGFSTMGAAPGPFAGAADFTGGITIGPFAGAPAELLFGTRSAGILPLPPRSALAIKRSMARISSSGVW